MGCLWAAITTLFCLSISHAASPSLPSVAVIYPEMREPYRSVFVEIVSGIEAQIRTRPKQYFLKESSDPAELKEWLQGQGVQTVIALGNRGLKAARELPAALDVIIGAVLIAPGINNEKLAGISLTPDPGMLFDRLKALAPRTKRITVVYDPRRNGWLIEWARKAATKRGLDFNALPAEDLHQAAVRYRDFLVKDVAQSDALWLPHDPSTLDDEAILPLILKEAWDRNLVVFSSNVAHVKRGVLFSLYPDNKALGRSLGALAGKHAGELKHRGVAPLRDLMIAVNARTADHLGLGITRRDRREFDLVFPRR